MKYPTKRDKKHAYLGYVWIELILLKLKTENWKHCSKIIFKCVNSIVRPIFNEKFDKKWNLWVHEQCTDALFTEDRSKVAATVHVPYMNSAACWGKAWKKKKKHRKLKTQQTQRGSKLSLGVVWIQVCVSHFAQMHVLLSLFFFLACF